MSWRFSKICSTLERKGFTRTDTDHAYFRLVLDDGRFTGITTKVSHGRGEIERNGYLFNQMRRQLKLSANHLADLFSCPMTAEAYVAQLRKDGAIQD